jgi:hypothetical protein
LQPGRARPFFGLIHQRGLYRRTVNLTLIELLGKLFSRQAGGLLLQLQLHDAFAAWLKRALKRQALFIGFA